MHLLSAVIMLLSAAARASGESCGESSVFHLEFEGMCNHRNLLDAYEMFFLDHNCTGDAEVDLAILLGGDISMVDTICSTAFVNFESLPFHEIANKSGSFDQMYFNGGTDWNEEVETRYPLDADQTSSNRLRDDAARVRHVYLNEARYGIIDFPDSLSNFHDCTTNAAMCCWPQDRQANDNNGNCNDPYDIHCVDKDPSDNTNLCFVDLERGEPSTGYKSSGYELFPGDDNNANNDFGEGPVHCHGFAWADEVNDPSVLYKGNNLFYISMYDHMHQRGYVRNIQGAPMCACTDQMPVVSRSDCTQIDVEQQFRFTYDGGFNAELSSIDITFNACRGINFYGRARNNDLWSYFNRLFKEGKVTRENFVALTKVIPGDDPDRCKIATEEFMATKTLVPGYNHGTEEWTIVAGKDVLDYSGKNFVTYYGPEAFRALFEASPNKILRRVCMSCVPQLQNVYYRRHTPIPTTYNLWDSIKNGQAYDPYNEFDVDFSLYSSHEDAIADRNRWTCGGNDYNQYTEGFPGDCGPDTRIPNQDTKFDFKKGKKDVAFYVEKSSFELVPVPEAEDIGDPILTGATWGHPNVEDSYYMTASGTGFYGSDDEFHVLWSNSNGMTEDLTLVVNIASLDHKDDWSKAGLIIRDTKSSNSAYFGIFKTGTQGVLTQKRTSHGGWSGFASTDYSDLESSWLKLQKLQNMFYAYKSVDGVDWVRVGLPFELEFDDDVFFAGLAVTARKPIYDSFLAEAFFTNYSHETYYWPTAAPSATPAPTMITTGIESIDIPAGRIPAGFSYHAPTTNRWTLGGAGKDIGGTKDDFHFVPREKAGDANITVTAYVESMDKQDSWTKAGVMIRDTLDANSTSFFVGLSGNHGITAHYRTEKAGASVSTGMKWWSNRLNGWVRVTKVGNTYTGYRGEVWPDGIQWVTLASVDISMNTHPNVKVGLAFTSHHAYDQGSAVLTDLDIIGSPAYSIPARLLRKHAET